MRCSLLLLIGFLCLSIGKVHGEPIPKSEEVHQIYSLISNLELDRAQVVLDSCMAADNTNPLYYLLENYIDFYKIFITEDKALYETLHNNKKTRIELYEKNVKTDSPYFRFCLAEMYLQWGLAKSKFIVNKKLPDLEFISDVNNAYRLLEENKEKYPNFKETNKSLSVIHALASYLPKLVRKMFQVRGSIELGFKEIQELLQHYDTSPGLFYDETVAIYSYMLLHLYNAEDKAWEVILNSNLAENTSPLSVFILSSVALKMNKNEEALDFLTNRYRSSTAFPFYYLDFLEGKALLATLDDKAKDKFLYFIQHFEGINYIKEAWQKLAWHALLVENDVTKYASFMQMVKKEGYSILEDDKQALQDAKKGGVPDTVLLKARILFDGGYYEDAKHHILTYGNRTIQEYHYRLGRIDEKLGSTQTAIEHYTNSLTYSRDGFFTMVAYYRQGLLYEEQQRFPEAEQMFLKCLDTSSDIYKKDFHQKAKVGLERISVHTN